jgi:hypothetical protein
VPVEGTVAILTDTAFCEGVSPLSMPPLPAPQGMQRAVCPPRCRVLHSRRHVAWRNLMERHATYQKVLSDRTASQAFDEFPEIANIREVPGQRDRHGAGRLASC